MTKLIQTERDGTETKTKYKKIKTKYKPATKSKKKTAELNNDSGKRPTGNHIK